MSQHSDSTAAQRHDESPCALSQARDQTGDGCSSTWVAAQSPVAMQLPPTTPSPWPQGHNLYTLRRVVHAVQSDFDNVAFHLTSTLLAGPPHCFQDAFRVTSALLAGPGHERGETAVMLNGTSRASYNGHGTT